MAAPGEIKTRLRLFIYSESACRAAILGQSIPHALGLPVTRLCIIRGIRYHHGYGVELRNVLPEFTRALNARAIMGNIIPLMTEETEFPYCIWYPDVATEATYRELVQRYPNMAYQVGRACAVAGYVDLYKELDILPEVHIAEEARSAGSMVIYNDIMAKPVRYAVMHDYTRTISPTPRFGAALNDDTAVCSSLAIKQEVRFADDLELSDEEDEPLYLMECRGYDENTFNITEDMNIDIHDTGATAAAVISPSLLDLLSSPLPFDLPAINKDLLILIAAYHGNIDRYTRLRRPAFISNEIHCCIRGIYHNTFFALWWQRKQDQNPAAEDIPIRIDRAISARMIMNNVLHRMQKPTAEHGDPYLIWYPSIAAESTYRELFRLRPSMAQQILRACIAGNYTNLFQEILLQVHPDQAVLSDATKAGKTFSEAVQNRLSDLGGEPKPISFHEHWKTKTVKQLQDVSNSVSQYTGYGAISSDFDGLYEGFECNSQGIDVFASLPEEWREGVTAEEEKEWNGDSLVQIDYKQWPRESKGSTT